MSSAVSELTNGIATPALHRAVGERGARVGAVSRGDRRRRRDVGNQNGGMSVNLRPVSELTGGIATPAIHRAADLDAHATEKVTHRARFENPSIARSPAARPRRARRDRFLSHRRSRARVRRRRARDATRRRKLKTQRRAPRPSPSRRPVDASCLTRKMLEI